MRFPFYTSSRSLFSGREPAYCVRGWLCNPNISKHFIGILFLVFGSSFCSFCGLVEAGQCTPSKKITIACGGDNGFVMNVSFVLELGIFGFIPDADLCTYLCCGFGSHCAELGSRVLFVKAATSTLLNFLRGVSSTQPDLHISNGVLRLRKSGRMRHWYLRRTCIKTTEAPPPQRDSTYLATVVFSFHTAEKRHPGILELRCYG
ncbi:hypothetical protein B0H14DRAFT_2792688 [Mycena olivaceomarginata]|nr:hypothetical protein B0H14DRAFT_2792688 [Mycena olivaceomarginata]